MKVFQRHGYQVFKQLNFHQKESTGKDRKQCISLHFLSNKNENFVVLTHSSNKLQRLKEHKEKRQYENKPVEGQG